MRICVLIRIMPSHDAGGMQGHTLAISEGFTARGHDVTVLTTAHPDGRTKETVNGVEVHYLKGTTPETYTKAWWKESLKAFKELHGKEPFDIIHSQSMGAYSISDYALKMDIPIVTTLHGTHLTEIRSFMDNMDKKLSTMPKLAYHFFDFLRKFMTLDIRTTRRSRSVICVSQELRDHVVSFVKDAKVVTVLNGIDTRMFSPATEMGPLAELKRESGLAPEERVILVYEVCIQVENTEGDLKPGLPVEVTFGEES